MTVQVMLESGTGLQDGPLAPLLQLHQQKAVVQPHAN